MATSLIANSMSTIPQEGFYYNDATHAYYFNGKRMTGITTILGVLAKPNLYGWYARMAVEFVESGVGKLINAEGWLDMVGFKALLEEAKGAGNKKKEAAGTHGTDAHKLVEHWIKGAIQAGGPSKAPLSAEYESIRPFIEWAIENVDHFLFSERKMYDQALFIAGTADFGCVLKSGQRLIGDFKTSSGVYGIDYFLQCAGYKILAESNGDEPYAGCVIVRLGKKGPKDFDVHYSYDTVTAETAFFACLTIYRAQATLAPSK